MVQLRPRTVVLGAAAFAVVAGVAVAALVIAITGRAAANDRFPDVATDSPFHDEINWLTDPRHQIATGFPNGTFRPQEPVNRQQAAFWLSNYNSTLTIAQNQTTVTGDQDFRTGVSCPAGKRPLAGWGERVAGTGKAYVTGSAAHGHVGLTNVDWHIDWDPSGTVTDLTTITYVLCGPRRLG